MAAVIWFKIYTVIITHPNVLGLFPPMILCGMNNSQQSRRDGSGILELMILSSVRFLVFQLDTT